jgi:hypothetical protein
MLVAHVDDSGSDENELAFVLAGFVSTSEKWARFSDEWRALCLQDPQTPDFKMKIAERLKGSGTYWGQGTEAELTARRDTKVQALASLIKKYALCRISASLDWHNYRVIARGRVPENVDDPYFFLFWELLVAVAHHQERTGVREKVDFIFDRQGVIGATAAFWHEKFIATLSPFARYIISGRLKFESDTDVLPLQAADMLAWHIRRCIEDEENDRESGLVTWLRPALATLLDLPCISANIDAEKLRWIVREVNHVEG